MPFHINNITQEITFSPHEVTNDILSGITEEFSYSGVVDVFDDDKLIDIGRINILYEKYKSKTITYKRHTENSRLEKDKGKEEKDKGTNGETKTKISRKTRAKPTPTPTYKMVNSNEPDIYVNKKFLS